MIFVDFLGDATTFRAVCEPLRSALAPLLRVGPESIVVRRVVTEGGADELEIWVELSSEEQVVRRGGEIAATLAELVRAHTQQDVWVMFRVVPRSYAFLNGRARARGRP